MHARGLGFEIGRVEPGMLIFFCFSVVESFKEYPAHHLPLPSWCRFQELGYFSNISKLNGRLDIYSQSARFNLFFWGGGGGQGRRTSHVPPSLPPP